jgi:uncharacterized membrane protein YsdA (DUF1294 family)
MRPRYLLPRSPFTRAIIPWFFFSFATGMLIGAFLHLSFIIGFFVGLNGGTFLLYGLDKMSAQAGRERIPEKILWLAAFLGGSIGAIAGMQIFRHKTKKKSFQFVLALLVLVQIAVVVVLLKYK